VAAQGVGRIYEHARGRFVLYIPAAVFHDTAFPFEPGSRVLVRISDDGLVVESMA
jgi:hypothetical protein